MDLYSVESFLSIVETRNFTRASEILNLTQPALSARVKQLEGELGYPLFIRRKGVQSIELTAQGAEFVYIAKEMMSLLKKAQSIKGSPESKMLGISIIDSVQVCTMPEFVHSFVKANPDAKIIVSSYHSYESYRHIENHEIDLAIVGKLAHAKGAITYPIYSDPWVFICGENEIYPDVVHPSELDSHFQLLLCNRETDDWQEYWFSGEMDKPGNKISYYDKHLFDDHSWAVLPLSIAKHLEKSTHGVIHRIKDGPAPRIVYMVQSRGVDSGLLKSFKKTVFEELHKIDGLTIMFDPEE